MVADLHESQWPRSLRNFVLGRIIGRVVAHEIGHWLLQTRDHSSSGLMRAVQQTRELADPARVNYTLTPAEIGRLREIVAREINDHLH